MDRPFPPGSEELTFDVSSVLYRARRLPRLKVTGIALRLPFLTVNVSPDDSEKRIAREVLIRLRDKRVLVASECCDSCIDNALKSIAEIRQLLVDKQVEIARDDSPLFIVLDLMLNGIRRFLTYVEVRDPLLHRDEYFTALDVLRGHLLRSVEQVALLGDATPGLTNRLAFNPDWEPQLYLLG
jgi:hypothetical protein